LVLRQKDGRDAEKAPMKFRAVLIGIVVGAVMVGTLACSPSKQNAADKPQEPKTTTAQPSLTPQTYQLATATEVFRLRSECAKLGEGILAKNPSGNDNFGDSQVSHYNPLTNRCYVETDSQNADLSKPLVVHRFLWDGQTGEMLAWVETDCTGATDMTKCKRKGDVLDVGVAMIRADKALGNTDNYTVKDSASQPEAFIDNVMADDRKQ